MIVNVKLIGEIRRAKGFSQQELGRRVGVTRQTVAAWEKGEREPPLAKLALLARELGVPLELFFEQPQAETPALLFRADDPKALSPELRALLSKKAEDYRQIEELAGETPVIPEYRPRADYDPDFIEQVAREVRDWLGVEDGPLGDVMHLLEQRGLKVILQSLPAKVSGFSAYDQAGVGAVIFINASHAIERQRFTALHELAHLIFHRQEYNEPKRPARKRDPREKTANHFAAAVLLPAEALKEELRGFEKQWLPLPLLADLRFRYGVSVRTVLLRAAQLKLISQKQMGQQLGWINKRFGQLWEPGGPLPTSQTLGRLERLVWKLVLNEQITLSRAAEVLGKPVPELHRRLREWREVPA